MENSGSTDKRRRSVVVELPLGDATWSFDLEKAVCSHGFFMMAPNRWDSVSKTFERPLRLLDDDSAGPLVSHLVTISQPPSSSLLLLRVLDTDTLSPQQQRSLMEQVRRMLRLSSEEERNVREFWEVYGKAKKSGFGRVFRSPTLFEDMVKCMLLCNCRWARTLSMARSLCELQLELQQCPPSSRASSNISAQGPKPRSPIHDHETKNNFAPKTPPPAGKDLKRKFGVVLEHSQQESEMILYSNSSSSSSTGNFPVPQELIGLKESFLEKRCGLGYRASRILKLARRMVSVGGRLLIDQRLIMSRQQLDHDHHQDQEEEEEDSSYCGGGGGGGGRSSSSSSSSAIVLSLTNYSKLAEELKKMDGFGPFVCANVLMCMGYYHVIPADSETIRHLRQVHGKISSIRDIQVDTQTIYGAYAPFQFLVYCQSVRHPSAGSGYQPN